jgi:hypothetical protein
MLVVIREQMQMRHVLVLAEANTGGLGRKIQLSTVCDKEAVKLQVGRVETGVRPSFENLHYKSFLIMMLPLFN